MDSPLHPPRPCGPRSSSALKTPEPCVQDGQFQPLTPPPRPPRFRLKKRAVSHLSAPTQQFLASVAAADVPIPSIEEPQVFDDMLETPVFPHTPRLNRIAFDEHPPTRGRTLSSPKTPAPRAVPSLSPKRFPDWSLGASLSSLESSPDCESSRPSTARSTQTTASLFSQFSLTSEDLSQCASPEGSQIDRFASLLPAEDADKTVKALARPATLRKAPWTRAMGKHLWSTYMMYLQDPKVTPFRIGKSGIPPSGVCLRVAREAKRSWKGSRSQARAENKSGSTTPTAETAAPYVEWPHTCAATRAHLRELCKANSGTATRNVQYLAHSPTPFGKTATRYRNRRSAPPRSPSVFSGSDMAMSLTVCTSDSMQPKGPLAQLAGPLPEPTILESRPPGPAISVTDHSGEQQRARLGSPFLAAKSYGPSSTNALADSLGLVAEPRRQSRTVGTRRSLGSPVRLAQSRSSTQKRRSRQPALEPRKSKRPSLGSDFWTDPSSSTTEAQANPAAPFAEFSSTSSSLRDNLFVPRTNVQELFEASHPSASGAEAVAGPLRLSLAPPAVCPPRLGSPFSAKSTSFSFPSRRSNTSSVMGFAAARRPFATVHQSSDAAAGSARPPLANRLAYIDERLKDFRRREAQARRSHSPL
ncbi:hypothetical protein HRG_002623 [Hirsutella rhossiliensis]|uniref:Uncharacterized protein n=1 Tax=Hirsutella rhossiliensis TaxID=111463 RepID=A0A9P8N7K5_9HYPO|nr:uncharacterized protein HRG_02623 [Hirsutella rhossiliensis]KAH0967214.1 hypothetical protein HRG_02623 [Hirsutella rhossiliensis]